MAITDVFDPNTMIGAPVHSTDGEKLGRIASIYYDNETNRPAWAATRTGLFGGHVSLVPLDHGNRDGSTLTVPFGKAALKNAPHHDPDSAISSTGEEELYRHYGFTVERGQQVGTAGTAMHGEHTEDAGGDPPRDRAGEPGIDGRDMSGPTTDDAMTRSEEQLRVGTEQRESGRARLRKHIVTGNVSTTVPASREEVAVEREPLTDANRAEAMSGADLSEEEHEVTLTEQRVVVGKETVPVECVRLATETVTAQQHVDETIRKEQIETDGLEPRLHRRDKNGQKPQLQLGRSPRTRSAELLRARRPNQAHQGRPGVARAGRGGLAGLWARPGSTRRQLLAKARIERRERGDAVGAEEPRGCSRHVPPNRATQQDDPERPPDVTAQHSRPQHARPRTRRMVRRYPRRRRRRQRCRC
jgi:uncharacterized protein (TIGR02271 family)